MLELEQKNFEISDWRVEKSGVEPEVGENPYFDSRDSKSGKFPLPELIWEQKLDADPVKVFSNWRKRPESPEPEPVMLETLGLGRNVGKNGHLPASLKNDAASFGIAPETGMRPAKGLAPLREVLLLSVPGAAASKITGMSVSRMAAIFSVEQE